MKCSVVASVDVDQQRRYSKHSRPQIRFLLPAKCGASEVCRCRNKTLLYDSREFHRYPGPFHTRTDAAYVPLYWHQQRHIDHAYCDTASIGLYRPFLSAVRYVRVLWLGGATVTLRFAWSLLDAVLVVCIPDQMHEIKLTETA